MTYFLIDDDMDDQEIFCMAVKEVDASVSCIFANDGIKGLAALANEQFMPDCIFIDLNMPRMNGNECLVEIKKIHRLSHIPVIIYSTSSDQKLISKSMELGASDFIVKPPGFKTLTDILREIIQKQIANSGGTR